MLNKDIQLPYGAVYFRKSNPPREDWERDYATAGQDGLNIFRHWFMWSAIETAPASTTGRNMIVRWTLPPQTASGPLSPS